jgi:hypothetical protein
MTRTEPNTDDAPADQIETLVVDPDDLVEVLRRNARDRDEWRTHELRDPPFGERERATPYVSDDHAHYPPDAGTTPLHIHPDLLHDADLTFPESWEIHEAAKEVDGVDALEAVTDETLDETWETHIEVWEGEVRSSLRDRADLNARGRGDERVVRIKWTEA